MATLLFLRVPFKHDFATLTVPQQVKMNAAEPARFQLPDTVPPGP